MRTAARYAALAAALAASGCGSGVGAAPPDVGPRSSVRTQTVTVTTSATADERTETGSSQPADVRVLVYFLRDGKIAATARRAAGPAVARAALDALAAGPTAPEREVGFGSEVPRGMRVDLLAIADGRARIEVSGNDACAGWAQVVYTLTQFPTVSAVESGCNDGPADRSTYEQLAPPILVETPAFGEGARSPVRIAGTANTFEATMWVELVDWDGRIVAEQLVTATSGSGERGTFDVTVPFRVDRPGGAVTVFERSADDGSRIHVIETPVRLLPH